MKQAKFIGSAANKEQWPETGKSEILLCGKSNVGKSSLINAICNMNSLAYVGKTPGKTRLLNFFDVSDDVVLVDAPGYGYYVNKSMSINNFQALMKPYFAQRESFKALLLLLDSRREAVDEDDLMILEMANQYGKDVYILLTKIDKISKNELANKINKTAKQLSIEKDMILPVSSEKKIGMDDLRDLIDHFED